MSNFWKSAVARESAGMEVKLQEDMVTEGSAFPSEDGSVESLEKDGEVLSDDMEQLRRTGDYIDSVSTVDVDLLDALDVGIESVRKRWGISPKRVATESLGSEDLRRVAQEANKDGKNTLWSRFISWLKEMANKMKDRWIAFSNAGKKLKKRSTAYKVRIKKLGKVNDDKISGGFIQGLSINGNFTGNDFSALQRQAKFAESVQKLQAKFLTATHKGLDEAFNFSPEKIVSYYTVGGATKKLNEVLEGALSTTDIIGNKYVAALPSDDFVSYEMHDRDVTPPEEVETPSTAILLQACSTLYSIGSDLEDQLKAFRKTNDMRLKIAGLEGKLQGSVDGLNQTVIGDKNAADVLTKMTQQLASLTISRVNVLSQVESYIWKNLGTNLDSYITTSIKAYSAK